MPASSSATPAAGSSRATSAMSAEPAGNADPDERAVPRALTFMDSLGPQVAILQAQVVLREDQERMSRRIEGLISSKSAGVSRRCRAKFKEYCALFQHLQIAPYPITNVKIGFAVLAVLSSFEGESFRASFVPTVGEDAPVVFESSYEVLKETYMDVLRDLSGRETDLLETEVEYDLFCQEIEQNLHVVEVEAASESEAGSEFENEEEGDKPRSTGWRKRMKRKKGGVGKLPRHETSETLAVPLISRFSENWSTIYADLRNRVLEPEAQAVYQAAIDKHLSTKTANKLVIHKRAITRYSAPMIDLGIPIWPITRDKMLLFAALHYPPSTVFSDDLKALLPRLYLSWTWNTLEHILYALHKMREALMGKWTGIVPEEGQRDLAGEFVALKKEMILVYHSHMAAQPATTGASVVETGDDVSYELEDPTDAKRKNTSPVANPFGSKTGCDLPGTTGPFKSDTIPTPGSEFSVQVPLSMIPLLSAWDAVLTATIARLRTAQLSVERYQKFVDLIDVFHDTLALPQQGLLKRVVGRWSDVMRICGIVPYPITNDKIMIFAYCYLPSSCPLVQNLKKLIPRAFSRRAWNTTSNHMGQLTRIRKATNEELTTVENEIQIAELLEWKKITRQLHPVFVFYDRTLVSETRRGEQPIAKSLSTELASPTPEPETPYLYSTPQSGRKAVQTGPMSGQGKTRPGPKAGYKPIKGKPTGRAKSDGVAAKGGRGHKAYKEKIAALEREEMKDRARLLEKNPESLIPALQVTEGEGQKEAGKQVEAEEERGREVAVEVEVERDIEMETETETGALAEVQQQQKQQQDQATTSPLSSSLSSTSSNNGDLSTLHIISVAPPPQPRGKSTRSTTVLPTTLPVSIRSIPTPRAQPQPSKALAKKQFLMLQREEKEREVEMEQDERVFQTVESIMSPGGTSDVYWISEISCARDEISPLSDWSPPAEQVIAQYRATARSRKRQREEEERLEREEVESRVFKKIRV